MDLAAFITMESLDIAYSIQDDDYSKKLITFISKVNLFHIKDNCNDCIHSISIYNDHFEISKYIDDKFNSLSGNRGRNFFLHVNRSTEIIQNSD